MSFTIIDDITTGPPTPEQRRAVEAWFTHTFKKGNMERKTFTAQGIVAGKLCDITFAPVTEMLMKIKDGGMAGDRMAVVIVACRSSTPDKPGGTQQEPFTAAEAEHILHSLEVLPPLPPERPAGVPGRDFPRTPAATSSRKPVAPGKAPKQRIVPRAR